jgi:hypothetical protein
MSRSDFWPVAVTLIVAGVSYFVGGEKSAYVCIALGVGIVLYLLFTHKKSEPASPTTDQIQTGQGGPQQQGQGAAQQQQQAIQQVTGDVHTTINYGPVHYHTETKGETNAGTN